MPALDPPFITADGTRLHVEVDGAGPPLVLVNGAFCTLRQWDAVVARLASEYTVIRHDVRGTGCSAAGSADANRFEQYADDLVAILDALEVDVAALWGMAWGARVALVTAAQHPDRVRPVVLTDLGVHPADVDAQKAGHKQAIIARSAAGIAEVPRPDGWNIHDDVDATMAALAATRLHPDLTPFADCVAAPVLVATGEFDPNLASSAVAVEHFADVQFETLALTGHGSVFDRPDHTVDVVAAFLRSHRS